MTARGTKFVRAKRIFSETSKKYKKLVYEEKTDSEPEIEENQ